MGQDVAELEQRVDRRQRDPRCPEVQPYASWEAFACGAAGAGRNGRRSRNAETRRRSDAGVEFLTIRTQCPRAGRQAARRRAPPPHDSALPGTARSRRPGRAPRTESAGCIHKRMSWSCRTGSLSSNNHAAPEPRNGIRRSSRARSSASTPPSSLFTLRGRARATGWTPTAGESRRPTIALKKSNSSRSASAAVRRASRGFRRSQSSTCSHSSPGGGRGRCSRRRGE